MPGALVPAARKALTAAVVVLDQGPGCPAFPGCYLIAGDETQVKVVSAFEYLSAR